MPYDPSGNFTRDYDWTTDRNNGVKVRADRMDGEFNNVATALNQVILRNGAAAFTGNIQMGGNSIISLADGTVGTPAIRFLGSPTTGLYSPGLDRVALTASGTNRVEANTTGVNTTGALAHTGTMSVSGLVSMPSGVTGGLAVNGNLNATGYIAAAGYATVGSTLGVTGATTLGSTLGVTGATTLGVLTVGSTLGVTGAATLGSTLGVTGKTTMAGAYLSNDAFLAVGKFFGLSGDNDGRTSVYSTTGAEMTLRVNNIGALLINSTGGLSALNTVAAGTDITAGGSVTATGGVFTGGATPVSNYGAIIRARSAFNLAADFRDSTGLYALTMRPNTSGVNMIQSDYQGAGSNLPIAITARATAADFQMLTNGNATFGNALTVGTTFSTGSNAGVGTATPNKTFTNRALTINGTSNSVLEFAQGDVLNAYIYNTATDFTVDAGTATLSFVTGYTQRFTLTPAGNAAFTGALGVGTNLNVTGASTIGGDLVVGGIAANTTLQAGAVTNIFNRNYISGVEVFRTSVSAASVDFNAITAVPLTFATSNTTRLTISGAGQAYLNAKQSPTVDTAIGYLGIPQVGGASKASNYTAVLADAGQHILMGGVGLTATVPANASVAYPVGTTLTFVNGNASSLSISINTDTMTLAGTTTTGTRTLAQNGVATAIKTGANSWIISGPGLS